MTKINRYLSAFKTAMRQRPPFRHLSSEFVERMPAVSISGTGHCKN